MKSSKFAFTLSEILITLGIIGVVAAITLPALIKNYQMKTYEVAFKKMYSTIQDALNYITTTENLSECSLSWPPGSSGYKLVYTDCSQLRNELIKNLQLQTLDKNMYKMYATKAQVKAGGGHTKNDSITYDDALKSMNSYLLKNGSLIFMGNNFYIVFDTNGKKGPNKWGYDVFWMTLTVHSSGKLILTDNLASLKEKGGRYPREILHGVMNSTYNKNW